MNLLVNDSSVHFSLNLIEISFYKLNHNDHDDDWDDDHDEGCDHCESLVTTANIIQMMILDQEHTRYEGHKSVVSPQHHQEEHQVAHHVLLYCQHSQCDADTGMILQNYWLLSEISNVCNIWYRCAHSVQIFYYVQSYQCWATASAWCVCVWHEARWQFFRKCIVCQIWSWVKMKGCTKSFIMIMLNVSKVVEAYCSVLLPWHYQGETHGYFNLTQIEELLLCCCACELLRHFNWSYVWKCFHGYQIDWYFIDVIVMGSILYQCLCKKSHKKCLTVKFPKNCSSFCQLWLQLLQLCSRSNHIDLDSSCSNNLQWFLGQLFDVQTMLQSSFSILQTA